jgi:hypothetical protein
MTFTDALPVISAAPLDSGGGQLRSDGAQPGVVLALFESGARGRAALREASEAARQAGARLVVGMLVWQQGRARCCGGVSPHIFNCAVRDEALEELLQARRLLGDAGDSAELRVVAGDPEPPLRSLVCAEGIKLVFVPRHRLARRGHWAARKLRSETVDVRLVK